MSVLSAFQQASSLLVSRKPDTLFSAQDPYSIEMQALVSEGARDISASHDWQALVRTHSITPDGTEDSFDLPADYGRMLLDSEIYEGPDWAWGYNHISRPNEWLQIKLRQVTSITPGAWTIQGDKFHFLPPPPAGSDAQFVYVTKNIAESKDGVPSDCFKSDGDTFVLSERLLTLWLVWRWRELKRLEASTDQANFEKAMGEAMARDGGSKIIRKGGRKIHGALYPAWPWPLGGI